MRSLAWLISLLWGVGQNLPFEQAYVHGIGPGDFIFLLLLALQMLHAPSREVLIAEAGRLQTLFLLLLLFMTLTMLSSVVNITTWGFNGLDLIEALRPLYYFCLVVYVSLSVRRYGLSIVIAYLTGIIASGMVAYMFPSGEGVSNFAVIWNPNVIGNMLAFGVLLVSLLILDGRLIAAALFLMPLLMLSVYTYSKGTWLMVSLGLAACYVAFSNGGGVYAHRWGKNIFVAGCIVLLVAIAYNFEMLYGMVASKLSATQFGDSAVDGGTVAARWGFVKASVQLASENPVFGIGISNFEQAYDSLKYVLGDDYWPTDNPHSAWLYIWVCIGSPALVVFAGIVLVVLRDIYVRLPLRRGFRQVYIGLVGLQLLISGGVLLHILTQYFFWFMAGVVSGWKPAISREAGR
jgi:hypothetical protein